MPKRLSPKPCLAGPGRAALLSVLLILLPLHAQEAANGRVEIPGGDFEAKEFDELKKVGWRCARDLATVAAPREWGGEERWLVLPGGSRLERRLEIEEIERPEGKAGRIDPARWWAVLSLSARRPADQRAPAIVRVRLSPPEGNGAPPIEAHLRLRERGAVETLFEVFAATELLPGEWRLEIASGGRGPVQVGELCLSRVPGASEEMHFAKSNGKNGPDRLVSGALGFIGHTADQHVPLPVKRVFEGGCAASAGLRPGDLVLGAGGRAFGPSPARPGHRWFWRSHEARLARAIERAHRQGERRVDLRIARGGKLERVQLRLAEREALSPGFPFGEGAAERLYEELVTYCRERQKPDGSWSLNGNTWIHTAFGGLALLGHRDPADREAIERAAQWYLRRFPEPETLGRLGYWPAAYGGIFLTEYWFASGDERVRPWLERCIDWVTEHYHTSKWGEPALGHGPTGLPYGNKALIAPASHLLVFEALARRAGLQSTLWEDLRSFIRATWSDPADGGHGAMGYNPSFKDKREFWARSGLFALAAQLRSEAPEMREGIVSIMSKRHPWMRNSHAYGYPGASWGLIGLHGADPKAFQAVMRAWRPFYGGAWDPGHGLRISTAHMGSPYMGRDGLFNLTTAVLLSVRKQGLVITGADPRRKPWMSASSGVFSRSRVIVEPEASGLVHLRPAVPGEDIVYTLDGGEPTARSARYSEPLSLPYGGHLRARVLGPDGDLGPESRTRIEPEKSSWRILEATGARTEDEAIRRAGAWIDGSQHRPWQPDRGHEVASQRLLATIDLGKPLRFRGVRFTGASVPKRVRIATSSRLDPWKTEMRSFAVEDDRVAFGKTRQARYLRIEIERLGPRGRARFAELDLLWPLLGALRGSEEIRLPRRTDGLELRVANPGGTFRPTELPARLPAGRGFWARLYDSRGEGVGPIRVLN